MKNRALEKLLSARNFDVKKLADQIFSSRSHVTQVLLGARKGDATWPKLERVMEPAEFKVAKEFADAARKKREQAGKSVGAFPELAGKEQQPA